MGDEPIIIEQFFYGFEGVIMGSIMGSQNIMGLDYGSNISGITSSFIQTAIICYSLQRPDASFWIHYSIESKIVSSSID